MNNEPEMSSQEPYYCALKKPYDIILVIPANNDGLTIGSIILKARPHVSKIIVVDDGSKDRTPDVAELSGAELIRFQQPVGKGAACIEGLKRAYRLGAGIAVLIDGDARYKTREIPWLISPIMSGNADVVIGSRYLEANGDSPLQQLIAQKIVPAPENSEITKKITDPLSGFIALNGRALEDLNFSMTHYDFKERLLEHLINRNLVIHEVAVTERQDIPKKIGWDECVKTVVALPAFNEETHIAKVILGARKYADAVLVVDDGSTDATAAIARKMGAIVISHPANKGYGAALQTMFSFARDMNLEALVVMDSDGQHEPGDIKKVLAPLRSGADVVIGSRFLDETKNHIPRYRKVGMKVLDTATAAAGVKKVTDSQSGFRAYGKRAISVIDISGAGMSGGSEILIHISDHNLNVVEVPISVRYDIKDTSTYNPVSHGISVLGRIIALISYRRPLPVFGIPGLIIFIVGMITAFYAFAEYYATIKFPYILSMGSAMLIILGLLLGISGLILNAMIVIVRENKR
jgi:glycosyltransferase involved in cell wall biosynthesis